MKDYDYYQGFSVHNFVLDHDFQKWVLHPTPELQHHWSNFLLLFPEKEKEVEQAKIMMLALDHARHVADLPQLEQEWNLLNTDIQQYEGRQKPKVKPLLQWYSIAASIVLCVVAGGLWWNYTQNTWLTFTTGINEMQTITLPDGSTAVLNTNSTLSFHKNWDASTAGRKVMLDGEAFFAVEKKLIQQDDTTYFSKFVVQTDQLEVEVLGTRFNVKSDIANTQVALEEGKVLVRNSVGDELYLAPGEIVELTGNHLRKKATEIEFYTSWKDNKLIFKDTPVLEILEMIETRYGYRIDIKTDYLDDKLYTGSSPANDIDLLIYKLSRLYDLSVKQEGKNLIITMNKP